MKAPIRVLIADDSAFVRKALRQILSASFGIEVVGAARDGLDALEKIAELAPDVVTLDLMMPHLDGLGVLDALPREGGPRVVVVSFSDADTELGAAALQAGALDIVRKPTALATEQLYEVGNELVQKVKAAAAASPRRFAAQIRRQPPSVTTNTHQVVVVGTSTGGPQAITQLLAALPENFPVPLLIALHIPEGYTEALASRLNTGSALEVLEANEGLELRPGRAILARGGSHLRVSRAGTQYCVTLDPKKGVAQHAPCVDYLFESAAALFGADTLGVVLTGMGDDGLRGSEAIHRAGGHTLTESEQSCVVYGMPRCVYEAGYSSARVALEDMAAEILRRV